MLLDSVRRCIEVGLAAWVAERSQGAAPRRSRDAMEFLPAALEIVETPASPVGRSLMWALMSLFCIALAWSAIGKLDIVAVAPGKLVPSGQSKVVQPLEAGIVSAILVSNGQHVRQGQVLIELDRTQTGADADKSRAALTDAALALQRARMLLAAQNGGALALAPVAEAPPARQRESDRLADSILREYRSKLAAQQQALQKREQEMQTTQHKIAALKQTVPMARALAEDYKALLAQNFMAKHTYLEKEQARIQQEQELAAQLSYVKELEATIAEQRQNVASSMAQFQREQMDLLNHAEQQLAEARDDAVKAKQRQSQTHLVAPVAGTVQQLAVHTVGGVVTPAQELMVIVPDNAELEVEAQVINQDIGFVRVGQPVEVKLDAFPYTHYGTLAGKISSISLDSVKDDKLGQVYPARIRLARARIKSDGDEVALSPGMTGAVEIRTEQRRILEYFLTPLGKLRSEALKER